jgi:hypothetical protein
MFFRPCRPLFISNRRTILEPLEERIVLDAAGDAGGQDNQDQDSQEASPESAEDAGSDAEQTGEGPSGQGQSESADPLDEVYNQDLNVVLISNALDEVQSLTEAAESQDATVVVYDGDQASLEDIAGLLSDLVDSSGTEMSHLAILSHGTSGILELSSIQTVSAATVQSEADLWIEIGNLFAEDARIDLYGCEIGLGQKGACLVETIASITGVTVWASDDTTGSTQLGDWDLEVRTGESDRGDLIDTGVLEGLDILLAVPNIISTGEIEISEGGSATITLTAEDDDPDGLPVAFYEFKLVGDTDGDGEITLASGATVKLDGAAYEDGAVYKQNVIYTPTEDYNNDPGNPSTWDSFEFTFGLRPGAPEFNHEDDIDASFGWASVIDVADVDGDGDLDVIGSSSGAYEIAWWEQTSSGWTKKMIASFSTDTSGIAVADLDQDGDVDIVAHGDENLVWFEQNGSTWSSHLIEGPIVSYLELSLADLDRDGDLDVIAAASDLNSVLWWDNTDGDASAWTQHTVSASFDGASSVTTGDLDNDGDLDILATASGDNSVTWWENQTPDAPTLTWAAHNITSSFAGASDVTAVDLDDDGDLDVLATASGDDSVTWWENTNRDASTWVEHEISNSFNGASSVVAADIDRDGDMDILATAAQATAAGEDDVAWWEQTETGWTLHSVDNAFTGAVDAVAADSNGDGLVDIVAAARNAGRVTMWYSTDAWDETPDLSDQNTISTYTFAYFGIGDMDGDGDEDIAASNFGPGRLELWNNDNGDGSDFSLQIIGGNVQSRSVVVGDIDRDGDLDLVQYQNANDRVVWWENETGDGSTWTERVVPGTIENGTLLVLIDLDQDGDLDIVCSSEQEKHWVIEGNELVWFENVAGDGSAWTMHEIVSVEVAYSVVVADFDGDGDLDVAYEMGGWVYWCEQTTTGWNKHSTGGQSLGESMDAADIDGDGDLDILTADYYDGYFWIENTQGDGSSWVSHSIPAVPNSGACGIRAADLDRDGDLDVVAWSESNDYGRLIWLENSNGDATGWTQHTIATGKVSIARCADINQDGWLEIIAGSSTTSIGLDIFYTADHTRTTEAESVGIKVTAVHDEPVAGDFTETGTEDTTLIINDWICDDSKDDSDGSSADSPAWVVIQSLPGHGTLYNDGVAVVLGTSNATVSWADATTGNKITFTPDQDWNGETDFTYTVNDTGTDHNEGTVEGTVTIDLSVVHDEPEAGDFTETGSEDTTVIINDWVFDDSADDSDDSSADSPAWVVIQSLPGHGTLYNDGVAVVLGTSNATVSWADATTGNKITFTPDQDWNGETDFTYTVNDTGTDHNEGTVEGTVTIDLSAVHDEPEAGDFTETGSEDTTVIINDWVFDDSADDSADSSADSPAWVVIQSLPGHGTLYNDGVAVVLGSSNATVSWADATTGNKITFTPYQDWNGETDFKYTVNDSGADHNQGIVSGTVTLDLAAVHDEPVAGDFTETGTEDTTVIINDWIFDDSADDSDDSSADSPVSLVIQSLPGNGTLYNDGVAVVLGSSNATVTWTEATTGNKITFDPDQDWNGETDFTYTVNDNGADHNQGIVSGTVTLDLAAVHDEPVAEDFTETGPEDTTVIINDWICDDSADDSDDSSADSPVSLVIQSLPGNGTLCNDGVAVVLGSSNATVTWSDATTDNNITFRPDEHWNGETDFTYTVNDSGADHNQGIVSGTVTLDLAAVHDEPVAGDFTETGTEDSTVIINDWVFDDSADDTGDSSADTPVSVVIKSLSANGTLYNDGVQIVLGSSNATISWIDATTGNQITFVPNEDWNGQTSFRYTVNDTGANHNEGTFRGEVSIEVVAVNDAPVVGLPGAQSVDEDTSVTITGITVDDVDVDEVGAAKNTLQVTLEAGHGTMTLSDPAVVTFTVGDGADDSTMTFTGTRDQVNRAIHSITYTPDEDYFGSDNIGITVDDRGHTGSGGPCIVDDSLAITVTDVPESGDPTNKSYPHDPLKVGEDFDVFAGESGALPPVGGGVPTAESIMELLSIHGLLPWNHFSGNWHETSSYGLNAFELLLSEALSGKDSDTTETAWNELLAFVEEGKASDNGETWLGLEAFLTRLREWHFQENFEDIRLVFNEYEITLAEWFRSLTWAADSAAGDGDSETAMRDGLSAPLIQGSTFVFDLNAIHADDLFTSESEGIQSVGAREPSRNEVQGFAKVFDLSELSFFSMPASS